jgi:hypothetical protein
VSSADSCLPGVELQMRNGQKGSRRECGKEGVALETGTLKHGCSGRLCSVGARILSVTLNGIITFRAAGTPSCVYLMARKYQQTIYKYEF